MRNTLSTASVILFTYLSSVVKMSKLCTASMMRQIMKLITQRNGYDRLAKSLDVIEAYDDGNAKFKFKIDESQTNANGTLHGGHTAFLVDFCTTAALMGMTQNQENKPGVSIELSVSYQGAGRIGEDVVLETTCQKLGSRIVFMEASFKNENGKLIATGKHTKYLL